mmetsp:Transcript_19034/g.31586  ORF Transcript_19034/g.31586 Transcript_19034/m.31586 type:complete len:337 (-) Transcript_19034:40-1050(-)
MRSFFYKTIVLLAVACQVDAFSSLPRATVLARTGRPVQLSPSFGVAAAKATPLRGSLINHEQQDDSSIATRTEENKSKQLRIAAVAGLGLATVALVGAQPSLAVDITGTATTFAASTSSLMESLSQTGFYQAFSLVFLSEIGDKTFFIAGLLAMKTSRLVSYVGSMGALAAMTVLSVLIGQIFHAVPAGFAQGIPLDDVAAVLAFAFFGYRTLKEALETDEDAPSTMDEEFEDAQEAVEGSVTIKQVTAWAQIASTFGLVFAAEFGDRSFLATIALSAAQNPVSVAGGAIAAHGVATGIAVAGGSFVAKYISEKVIGIISGILFLVFALTTAFGIF